MFLYPFRCQLYLHCVCYFPDLKILLTVMSLIEELLYNSNATGDQLRVFETYSEAVLDFAVVLVEQLVEAEVSPEPRLLAPRAAIISPESRDCKPREPRL